MISRNKNLDITSLNWFVSYIDRVLRRFVTLISQDATLDANFEAARRQAESATAAAKHFLEEQANRVCKYFI